MDNIERRFLIYNGFKEDSSEIFQGLINKFGFKITHVDECSIYFINNRCNLNLTYESGIQLWLKVPIYNISEMIPILCMFKGADVFDKYRNILIKEMDKKTMIELSQFLMANFSEELREN